MDHPKVDISTLTPDERLDLIEQLWESLSEASAPVALTDGQREELDRRLDDLAKDNVPGIPWDDVLERLRGNRK